MESLIKKERFIDVLTVLSCVAVVYLHCNGIFWSRPTGSKWITSTFIETFFYFAVPIFFMISGYTLLGYQKRYNNITYFKKRFYKAVIPFLAWSAIAYVFVGCFNGDLVKNASVGSFVFGTINCSYFQIYWFFIPLFACYLSIPVFSILVKEGERNLLWLVVVYSFISYSIIPFISSLCGINININLLSPVGGGYILYILLGYLLGTAEISKGKRIVIYLLGIFGFFCHFLGTLLLSPVEQINHLFKGYLNFPCVLHSVAIFVFVEYTNFSKLFECVRFRRAFDLIKSCSLPIYLIHGFFVYYIIPNLGWVRTGATCYRLVAPIFIIGISVCLTLVIRRVPFLKRIVP